MTSEDLRGALDRRPFVPLRLHLVSGKTIDVPSDGVAWMLQNAVMILKDPRLGDASDYHDLVSLRNIERVEQVRPIGKQE